MNNTSIQPIAIFRAGHHTDMNGVSQVFTDADLRNTAEAYAPSLHEAPMVVGHPQHDAPAHGWVAQLRIENGHLLAVPKQVSPAFAEMVNSGRFKKISASFYTPTSPRNPQPGVYYLRHVGFLGAQPPAIKGLPNASFSEQEEDGVIEFSDQTAPVSPGLPPGAGGPWLGLRDWVASIFGQEAAEKAIPTRMLAATDDAGPESSATDDRVIQAATDPTVAAPPQPVASPDSQAATPSIDEATTTPEPLVMDSRSDPVAVALIDSLAQEIRARQQEALAGFIANLVQAGQILPRDQNNLRLFLEHLAIGATVSFHEEDAHPPGAAGPVSPLEWLQQWLLRLPVQVTYAEAAALEQAAKPVRFTVPTGYQVDADRLRLHQQAMAYATNHQTDYMTAVKLVAAASSV